MARSTPSKTAARTAARPARRAPRARAAAAPADRDVEADIARAAERAHAAPPAHALPHGPEAFGAAIGDFLNSLSGLQVPQATLAQLHAIDVQEMDQHTTANFHRLFRP